MPNRRYNTQFNRELNSQGCLGYAGSMVTRVCDTRTRHGTEYRTEKTSSNKTLSKHCNCGWANDEHEPQTPTRLQPEIYVAANISGKYARELAKRERGREDNGTCVD